MKTSGRVSACLCLLLFAVSGAVFGEDPQPRVVTAPEGAPPSDAVALFNGSDLSEWVSTDGSPANWRVGDGAMTVTKGGIITKREFGDVQLHIEWAAPAPPKGAGQDRGNSGVYLQERTKSRCSTPTGTKRTRTAWRARSTSSRRRS